MQQPDFVLSADRHSQTMAQSNFNNSPTLMGSNQLALNDNKNSNKDVPGGAFSKSGRSPRPNSSGSSGSGGRRRKGCNPRHQQRHQASLNDATNDCNQQGGSKNLVQQQPEKPPIATADEFEAGSIYKSGSKKMNMSSQLLKFKYEPRGHQRRGGNDGERRSGYNNASKKWSKNREAPRSKYDKEQYIQANCQFVVRSGPDYSQHLSDPDLLVDWELIEQIVLKTAAKVPSCPICLSPPIAAKMTRCGHVYCWTCMLHYLSLSDDDFRKCPICFEEVKAQDLKSVVSIAWREFKMGEEIEFTLMRRERRSLFAMPVDDYFPEVNGKHPNLEQPNSFSQLVTADPQQVCKEILSREHQELLALLDELKDDPTGCYVEQALNQLIGRESSLALNAINIDQVRPDVPVNPGGGAKSKVTKSQAPKETFYFYQSSDGQPIFLHGLNVEMLTDQHGTFDNCPRKIKGKILEKDSYSMSLDLRNKMRYLMHVPVARAFEVFEIELEGISQEVESKFKDQMEVRKSKRNKRARDERKREKRIQVQENKLMGRFPEGRSLRIESEFHFPGISGGFVEETPIGRSRISESSGLSVDSGVGDSSPFPALPETPGASFAKMLREGVPKTQPPRLVRSETFPTSTTATRARQASESEPEDYIPPPPVQTLYDAVETALLIATKSDESLTVTSGKKKGKKSKGKKVNLFPSARPFL